MPLFLLSFVKQFWLPLAILAAIIVALGSLKYYGWKEYRRGVNETMIKVEACETSFKIEQGNWVAQVKRQQEELEAIKQLKQQVVEKKVIVYRDTAKKVEEKKKETDNEVKANIRAGDTVIVPTAFVSVYNSAVEGSRIATGNEGKQEVSRYSSGTIGTSTVFDATAFTQVVKGNVDQYNELAARYTKLVELVEEIEKLNER